ncbi:hypothetical protein [Tenacibaculum singaporense]|uniref:hypothetical protein n=1 Tax=Tenacibaculum singaporense TaxID=2358479 RepID=UPI0035198B95
MKLDLVKNLGKELRKEELISLKGGDIIIHYGCSNGKTGTIRKTATGEHEDPCSSDGGLAYEFAEPGDVTG